MNIVLAGMLTLATIAAQPFDLAHPDAKALIGIDIRSLRRSTVRQVFADEIDKARTGMVQFPGMAFLDEIDRVFISSPGARAGAKKGSNPPVLVVVTGHFADEHVRQLLHGPHRGYHNVDLYPSSSEGGMSMAMLDESTLLLGDEPSLQGAIDRHGQSAKNPSALLARAAAMSNARDVWVIATVSPAEFQTGGMNLGRIFSDIRGIDAGFSVHEGLDIEVAVLTKTPEVAHEIGEQISEQLRAAVTSKLNNAQATEFARKLQVGSDGNQLRVKFALSKDELESQIRTMKAARAPAPAPSRNTIQILGLDEGVREIPLGPRY